jgi:hypothetical protein
MRRIRSCVSILPVETVQARLARTLRRRGGMVELSFRGESDVYIPLRFRVDSSIQGYGSSQSFFCRTTNGTPFSIHCDHNGAVATFLEELRA